jgi:hypothetical protein
MTSAVVVAGLVFLLVVGGLIVLGMRLWRGREHEADQGGLDLIPYLLMALAVGVAGFSLARLARASLTPDRLVGRPTGEIAGALAGLVVAAPITYFLWRRQAKRRTANPRGPGWPIYLAAIELVFLTAFFVAVAQLADAVTTSAATAQWPDLVVYGGIIAFHWWAERRQPLYDDAGEVPRLVGSSVALIAMVTGMVGTATWLLSEAYEAIGGSIAIPEPAVPLALLVTALPVWAWRWLPDWSEDAGIFRRFYLAVVTAVALTMSVGAAVALVSVLVTYLVGEAGRPATHFDIYPTALALAIVGLAVWLHHRPRIGEIRSGALRGYEYGMAATGLSSLVATSVAFVNAIFEPFFAGNSSEVLIVLACSVIASGWVWMWFWRKVQAAPRDTETRALQRRFYLIGMTIVTGLTAAGALIALLVVVFQAVLGEGGGISDSIRLPLTITIVPGLAAWHLFTHLRTDSTVLKRVETRPFTVTIVCSHPGDLAGRFPKEATTRVLYRADDAGTIDGAMADAIVAAVGTSSSLVWVDGDGFRVGPAREP